MSFKSKREHLLMKQINKQCSLILNHKRMFTGQRTRKKFEGKAKKEAIYDIK